MSWTSADAEAYLDSLEPVGWRFGLERMGRLVTALGMPQHRFASVHVVGTNGKSSVTAMGAELLRAHGMRSGAYLSPHEHRWEERIVLDGAPIEPAALAAALERVSQTAAAVERTLEEGERVTQFEAITAAAFVAMAAAGVEVGVIEAGLGGRLDATNVLPSRVTALTSVALEHTELLGDTEEEIATEKLAVLRPHSTLIAGRLPDSVRRLAREHADALGARFVDVRDLAPAIELRNDAPFLRRDFAVALAAAETILGRLDVEAVREVAASLELAGRAELRDGDPPLLLDVAHNPAGAAALAEAVAGLAAGRQVIACVAILAGKDAAGILAALAPVVSRIVLTSLPASELRGLGRPGESIAASELARLAAQAGIAAEPVEEPSEAVARTVATAREQGGVALVTGSHYLLSHADPGNRPSG
ncbi:bifunctional folylpolyglutamate synthase/dihydrofolate synthase [Thermoleophilia bacterium SCSIO 60948]|nr:bifunctional folylpolyglutamate synthase/dihydrofolate synthase [Thermoleophilia bacterium SCSIO 60948]